MSPKERKIKSSSKNLRKNIESAAKSENFSVEIEIDSMSYLLFALAALTRFYRLSEPKNVVFEELNYGRLISMYIKNVFFLHKHPPLGIQLISSVASIAGYDGKYEFKEIGSDFSENVSVFWLRFLPAFCGSLLASVVYNLLLQLKIDKWIAAMGGLLIILDNALLTQSKFIFVEPIQLIFSFLGLLFLMKFIENQYLCFTWWMNGLISAAFLTFSISVNYSGIFTYLLAIILVFRKIWSKLKDRKNSNFKISVNFLTNAFIFILIPIVIYILIFYIHFSVLYRAGPNDTQMTSTFQASLEDGLAKITHGQPIKIIHGSRVTLRSTNNLPCWLSSNGSDLYPLKYPDKRGSSHQQVVTCETRKVSGNWWVIRKVTVSHQKEIKDGDIIELMHHSSSRYLNSHFITAPITSRAQEVSCYIDYNISVSAQKLWRVQVTNKNEEGDIWTTIKSHVKLVHLTTKKPLKLTGRKLPEWGHNNYEVVTDHVLDHAEPLWNVEEHVYTEATDLQELEKGNTGITLIGRRHMTFWKKLRELQMKMLFEDESSNVPEINYFSSDPLEWPFMSKGIIYWHQKGSKIKIHLLGNKVIWYSSMLSLLVYCSILVIYMLRRRRHINDLGDNEWEKFKNIGWILFLGYFINFIPYFFAKQHLFLTNYLSALIFKICILCAVVDYTFEYTMKMNSKFGGFILKIGVLGWLGLVLYVFKIIMDLSYGSTCLEVENNLMLISKDFWEFLCPDLC